MNKCCEKWTLIDKGDFIENERDGKFYRCTYCPECGSKLESEWCECKNTTSEGAIHQDVTRMNICNSCHKPIKPKRELPEKIPKSTITLFKEHQDYLYAHGFETINEIIDYLGGE